MDGTVTILTILVTVIGVVGLLQLLILLMMFLGLRKGVKEISAHAADIKAKVNPLIDQTRETIGHTKGVLDQAKSLIARLEPKLEMAAADLAEITRTASQEVKNIQNTSTEINDRIRRQALRVESLSNRTLDGVDRAGRFVGAAASAPARQFTGLVAAARAVMDTLRKPAPGVRASGPKPTPSPVNGERIREERSDEKRDERAYYGDTAARSRQ